MDDTKIDTETYKGFEIEIHYDMYGPESPREWENLGTLILWDSRGLPTDEGNLRCDPDEFAESLAGIDFSDYPDKYDPDVGPYGENYAWVGKKWLDEEEFKEYAQEKAENEYTILPVYKYEHGGVMYNTGGFSCPWDSGQVGFIYVSNDKAKAEYGWKYLTKMRKEKLEEYLKGEIEIFSSWANGEVYGYRIPELDGMDEEIHSCWDFYGYDHEKSGLLDSARESIDWYLNKCKQTYYDQLKLFIRARAPLYVRKRVLNELDIRFMEVTI